MKKQEIYQRKSNESQNWLLSVWVLSILISFSSSAQVFIPYQSTWKYAPESSTPLSTGWEASSFSDAGWNTGKAPFGFGNHFFNTQLQRAPGSVPPNDNYPVYYFRKTFTISNTSTYSGIRLRAYLDDAIVIYVNGVEVARKNMNLNTEDDVPNTYYGWPTVGNRLTIDTVLSTSSFVNGTNVIAVELHQGGSESSDVLFDVELEGVIPSVLIPFYSNWKYFPEDSMGTPAVVEKQPVDTWKSQVPFADSTWWKDGNASFGFGRTFVPPYNTVLQRGQGNTTPNHSTFFFRKEFKIANAAASSQYRLKVSYDDAFIIYINGVEVTRQRMVLNTADPYPGFYGLPAPGDSASLDTLISNSFFHNGTNLVAVELHQTGSGSSDIYFNLELTAATPATPAIYRNPYLQLASHNRMEIRWYTTIPTNATVRYSTSPSLSSYTEVNVPNVDDIHRVTLKNLIADTKYYYSIGYNTGASYQQLQYNSAVNYFRTLPDPSDTTHALRFWLLGDSGGSRTFNTRPKKVRDAYLAYLNSKGNPHVDGALFLGDNSNLQDWEGEQLALDTTFFRFYNRANDQQLLSHIPSWIVFGNHDYDTTNYPRARIHKSYHEQKAASFSTFAFPDSAQIGGKETYNKKGYYSFDQGNIHFVVLNPYLIEGADTSEYKYSLYGTVGPEHDFFYPIHSTKSISRDTVIGNPIDSLPQVKWLVEDLLSNTKKWTVVTFHIPPFSTIGHFPKQNGDDFDLLRVRERLMPILEKPEYRVDAVIVSHSHAYLRAGMIRKNGTQPRTTDYTQFNNLGQYPSLAQPPYIKSNSETAYAYILSGNAGRGYYNNGEGDGGYAPGSSKVQHPSTSVPQLDNLTGDMSTDFYHVKGGSVELLFRENRLDVKYIQESDVSPYFVEADSFVVMKDVNKTKTLTSPSGTTTFDLKASWVGEYKWRNSPDTTGTPLATTRTFSVTPTATTTYYVRDNFNHLLDTFTINVLNLVQSVKSGSWHDPTTWDCNCIPNQDQEVKVNTSHTITVSTGNGILKKLTMNGGVLQFQNGRTLCIGCTP